MDLDPFCPIGITAATIRFLDVFLLHCLLRESPADTPQELGILARNLHQAAGRGRDPGLRLARRTEELTPAEWGAELLREYEPIAAALDHAHRGTAYRDAVSAAGALLADPAATPSARILREMAQNYDNSYLSFALAQSTRHRDLLLKLPLAPETDARFARMAAESLAKQRQIEAADSMPFEAFRRQYLAQDLLSGIRLAS